MKYIPAEKLIAEINNRLMSVNLEELGNFGCHRVYAYNDVKEIITSLQQEQPNDICQEINEYYGENIPFEDERSKAAYHFFSSGRTFELKQIEEREKQHITDLLDNYKKGMKAGYQKALSALKDYNTEGNSVLYEFLAKLLESEFGLNARKNEI